MHDTKNGLTGIGAALQWDRGRWIGLLSILLVLAGMQALGDDWNSLLRYDRGAIAGGGWWRLLTAHLVHLNAHHLLLNALGIVLVWSLFAGDYDGLEWCAILLSSALGITAGLFWLSRAVTWYVGASGLLHAAMAAGVVRHLAAGRRDRFVLTACFMVKLAVERMSGHPQPLVVIDAHAYGALAGSCAGAALCARMAIIRLRHSP